MTDSMKLAEMQRTSIEFERQRHLANWLIKSGPHMPTPPASSSNSSSNAANTPVNCRSTNNSNNNNNIIDNITTPPTNAQQHSNNSKFSNSSNPVFFLMSSNGQTTGGGPGVLGAHHPLTNGSSAHMSNLGHHVEGHKPKLRRFNSHEASSNMFSVADFENARLARRNEIELKQRMQRRMRLSANGSSSHCVNGSLNSNVGMSGGIWCSSGSGGGISGSPGISITDNYSTGDSKTSKYSNDSQHEALPADMFLDRYSLPRVVRISYKTKFSDETLQSSSSNGSSTATSHSSGSTVNNVSNNNKMTAAGNNSSGTSTTNSGTATSSSTASSSNNLNSIIKPKSSSRNHNNSSNGSFLDSTEQGDLYLLYRLVRQRYIYHGYNGKTAIVNRKKGVLIPQEFPGYFSLLNDKGIPTATQYTSLIQLVRERVYKFISVDNMPAFTESQANQSQSPPEGCLPLYSPSTPPNRPQYVKTTARGGQVFRLLAVFEDGKQDHNAISGGPVSVGLNGGQAVSGKSSSGHGREKEKGRYAQLLNENRQVLYVPLSTKGKFYEIEPGIPQILQKLGAFNNDANKKINPDCVHRITALVSPNKELPMTLRYISGPIGCANAIPETLCITKITTENILVACPIEDVEMQSPLHLRKLHLTKEMNLLKCCLGFENEQRMFANPNVQNILKYCQFNCDQFLKMVEVEVLHRSEHSSSKHRGDALKILKPLHFPKLLRREKTTISAHEKEDSIIFLTKNDLANMEAKEAAVAAAAASGHASLEPTSSSNRISEKMKVFQSSKKKWFRRQDKHAANSLTALDLEAEAKRMSMERYTDMSKLLQERFSGDKAAASRSTSQEQESISDPSAMSDVGCSDTETTALTTIAEKLHKFESAANRKTPDTPVLQKSLSLQDLTLERRKPYRLAANDTISEAGTDLDDLENLPPLRQTSFLTEKLFNEFHVKTRQYSKSSSSLHQLLNFSLPQKLHIQNDSKRTLAQLKHNFNTPRQQAQIQTTAQQQQQQQQQDKRLDFNIGAPVTGRRAAGGLSLISSGGSGIVNSANSGNSQNTSLMSPLTPLSFIEDDLPYSSVRDSLLISNDDSGVGVSGGAVDELPGNICQALDLIDYTKENIYAEICHEASAMGGIPSSQTRDTFSAETHSTHISTTDDYGDYASLSYPMNGAANQSQVGNAISRVRVNCSASPVSYHTVYFGDEPLGEHHANVGKQNERGRLMQRLSRDSRDSYESYDSQSSRDRTNITTVELEGSASTTSCNAPDFELERTDNIYNTLK